jgi:hypothetical protein
MENKLKYIAGQRTFAGLSKMPVVTVYSSFKENWKEKVIPHSAMGEKYGRENKFCGKELGKTAVTCVYVEIAMHVF